MRRRNISTHTPSEERIGYSRAIVVSEKRIYFSGTTSMNEKGETVGKTVFEQSDYIFEKMKDVLTKTGFSLNDVFLIRAYLLSMKDVGEFDKAFIKHFSEVHPCCTLVGTSELVKPDLLIEIECIAEKD